MHMRPWAAPMRDHSHLLRASYALDNGRKRHKASRTSHPCVSILSRYPEPVHPCVERIIAAGAIPSKAIC